jgi:creatinine amidohydrolase
MTAAAPNRWSDRTADAIGEAAAAGAVLVLPIGATEQHGPHLPTGTDTMLATYVAEAAAVRADALVLPELAYGCSLGHTDRWPGTLSLHPTTMIGLLLEVGEWAYRSGFRKLVIVNGHATNGPPAQSALLQLRHEHPDLRCRFVSIFDLSPQSAARYRSDVPDFHANEAETSMLLYLDPDHVLLERAVDEPDRTIGRELMLPMPAVTASGVVGTPSLGDAAQGQALLDELVDELAQLLRTAATEADPDFSRSAEPGVSTTNESRP